MNIVEKFINIIGEYISYLIPLMTLFMIIVIVSRYFFGIGQTGLQELVMYFHALVFLGCAGYAFNKDEHVRVDIFYRDASDKYKNVINLIFGVIFLLPVTFIIVFYSIELISMSWKIRETSTEAGGLGYVFIQKTFIFLFPITLFAAFINQLIKIIWK
ncbi:TRAP transporter small permease subunit [Gammaproteobacteria bacterium]|nr:TRAP transporter small permease subunit [Gammaproteobacteria bacterium]MDC1190374.1 TRAP transporter small permease subunit [Gammaproteobacteria bacterium]